VRGRTIGAGIANVMAGLLMVEANDATAFPAIDWDRLEDDHSDDRVGYWFAEDDRNV